MSVIGNIIGILIVQPNPSPSIPKKGMLAGLFIFLSGFIVGLILKLPFGSYLPISNYSDITSIGNGIGGKWYPWFVFTTGGATFVVFLLLRLVEFRGISAAFAKKTAFFRIFGVPAFTVYCFHQFIALGVCQIVSLFVGFNITLNSKFSMLPALGLITLSILVIYLLLRLWEKVGYVGGFEMDHGRICRTYLSENAFKKTCRRGRRKSRSPIKTKMVADLDKSTCKVFFTMPNG